MKKKAALILALLLVLSLGLSACGKPAGNTSNGASNTNNVQPPEPPVTAESLIKGFADKTGSGTGVIYNMELAMKMSVSVMGQNQSVSMEGQLKTESRDGISHVSGTMTADEGEGKEETTLESWTVKEGDKFIAYTKDGDNWYKQELDIKVNPDSLKSLMFAKDVSRLALSEADNEYHVDGTVDIATMMGMINEVMGSMDDMGDLNTLDLSDVAPAKVSYRFDKATKDLISCEIDMKESFQGIMDKLIKSMVEDLAEQGAEEGDNTVNPLAGMDLSSFFKIQADEFKIWLKDVKVDPALKLELPEEAKNASVLPVIPDDFIGFYVEEMTIYLPSSFKDMNSDEYGLTALYGSDEHNCAVAIRREDKKDVGALAKDLATYADLLLKANAKYSPGPIKQVNGRPVFEYSTEINGTNYSYYTTAFESENAFWMVQFSSLTEDYEDLIPLFRQCVDSVDFF